MWPHACLHTGFPPAPAPPPPSAKPAKVPQVLGDPWLPTHSLRARVSISLQGTFPSGRSSPVSDTQCACPSPGLHLTPAFPSLFIQETFTGRLSRARPCAARSRPSRPGECGEESEQPLWPELRLC